MIRLVGVAALICWATGCVAQPMRLNEWLCVNSLDEFANLELAQERVRVNNFLLAEDKSWVAKEALVLNFSASGVNRGEKSAYLTLEVVGYNASGAVIFAVTAQPMMSMLSSGKSEQITGNVYAAPGVLEQANRFCVLASGEV